MGHQPLSLPPDVKPANALQSHLAYPVGVHHIQIASCEADNIERLSHEDISELRWEDEGGAYAHCPHPGYRINSMSPLQTHIDKAAAHLSDSNFDEAIDELRNAAARYKDYTATLDTAFSTAISQLSSPGCPATPPHPKTIELVRIGRSYKT